jgi:glycosyltransferase involved in cell wall biosynthesis
MIIQGYHPLVGGAERQLASLIPELSCLGVEATVLTRRWQAGLAPYECVDGVPVYRLPVIGPKVVASAVFTLTAVRLLGRLRPHVIHAHELLSPTTTALTAKRLYGIPVVAKVLRGGGLGDLAKLRRKPAGRRRIGLFSRQVDAFIAISREIEAELAEIGVPAERRVFIPNGVDIRRFTPAAPVQRLARRQALGLRDAPTAVFTGRLAPEKRVDHLLALWPEVRAAVPGAQLVVVGTGEAEAQLRQAAGEGVVFAGRQGDVLPYLQAADVFVLPSIAEGLSNALLEAMAVGLAVVATEVGGAPDLVTHGVSGWLIPPDSPAALSVALRQTLADPAQTAAWGRAARAQVVQAYALPAVAERLRQLYHTCRR